MLDLVIFIHNNKLHTKENRKDTAANSYLQYGSAHPSYTFKGIVKSQMYRLRRLCSRDEDYVAAIDGLRERCKNSSYDMEVVENILKDAPDIVRNINQKKKPKESDDVYKIRWVTMSHSAAEKETEKFVTDMNAALKNQNVAFEVIKTTAPTIGKLLFNNNNNKEVMDISKVCKSRCQICTGNLRGDTKKAKSKATGETYSIDQRTCCRDSGIYMVTCKCEAQYIGKTTVQFNKRFNEHTTKNTSVKEHLDKCNTEPTKEDIKVQYLENMWDRGKYTLSEREYLWNRRLRGSINVQKILKNCT